MDELSISEIRNEIIRFKNDANIQKLESRYKSKSMAEILGVSRKELAHSNFIAWLFNTVDLNSYAKYNLKKLIELLSVNRNPSHTLEQNKFLDAVISDDLEFGEIEVVSEKAIGKNGRVDILISFDYFIDEIKRRGNIVIENKVSSVETGDQTNRYFQYFENEMSDHTNLYVFLTPLSAIEFNELEQKPQCKNKSFIQINYQLIVDYILEPLIRSAPPPHIERIINDYLLALSQPTFTDEENQKEIVMAIGEQERAMLMKFWDNHKSLLLAILDAISTDPSVDIEDRTTIKSALSSITKTERDRGLINIYYEGQLEFSEIRKADIGLNTILTLQNHNALDDLGFEYLKKVRSCGFDLIKKKEEITENEAKYKRYRINTEADFYYKDKPFYIARNWGRRGAENFKEVIENKFPKIKIEFLT